MFLCIVAISVVINVVFKSLTTLIYIVFICKKYIVYIIKISHFFICLFLYVHSSQWNWFPCLFLNFIIRIILNLVVWDCLRFFYTSQIVQYQNLNKIENSTLYSKSVFCYQSCKNNVVEVTIIFPQI